VADVAVVMMLFLVAHVAVLMMFFLMAHVAVFMFFLVAHVMFLVAYVAHAIGLIGKLTLIEAGISSTVRTDFVYASFFHPFHLLL
jgi:hypothetical protein